MCGETKPRSAFYTKRWFDRKTRRHRTRTAAFCRACECAYQRQRLRHRYRTDPAFRARLKRYNASYRARRTRETAESRAWLSRAAQQHLAQLRQRGWTGKQIAAAINVSPHAVYHWEHGRHAPKPEHLRALRALAEREANRDQDAA
jgi:ribosome-binding protein aMBF1 (putative translation factor)